MLVICGRWSRAERRPLPRGRGPWDNGHTKHGAARLHRATGDDGMSNVIKFGTDGWRAIIAEDFTFANVRALAASIARYLKQTGLGERGLVIGYDTRYGSERFAEAVTEVITAAGLRVALTATFAPTPAVSHAIVSRGAGGAVVVTSSHNPASWNGIKYKPEYAGSA